MFIKDIVEIKNSGTALAFIKSYYIQAYPCGRRGANPEKASDIRIPYDPEARLNTEANNRKHSSLNGFTQTYLNEWDTTNKYELSLALAGYLFHISLPTNYRSVDAFGKAITTDATATKIYANILLEDVHLFSGYDECYTQVLRNQTALADNPRLSLDLPVDENNPTESAVEGYYFSGLSFSTEPLTGIEETWSTLPDDRAAVNQLWVSLCLMEKTGDTWKIYEPARLPKIEHGTTTDSIVLGDTLVQDTLTVEALAKTNLLQVDSTATIEEKLLVNTSNNSADINTSTIAADTSITAPTVTVTANLTVQAAEGSDPAVATIDKAIIAEAEVTAAGLTAATIAAADITEATITTATIEGATLTTANIDESIITNAQITTATIGSAAIESATVVTADITNATITTATTGTANITDATITRAEVDNATIAEMLVQNEDSTAKATIDDLTATKAVLTKLAVGSTAASDISTLEEGDIKATAVSADTFTQAGNPVPTINLVQLSNTEWQLQISNIRVFPLTTT